MASYGHPATAAAPRHGQPVAYGAVAPGAAMPALQGGPPAPAGTFSPGTKIQVGSHRVVIQKYLSEGGFAHVYLVKLPKPIDGTDMYVLKRVAVPDKDALRNMRTEVETMKRLKGHRPIVTYIDSHASELRGGGYEVFLLMEYCNGGGLIDFMNTRLQHRLTEPEILQIFTDVAEGVACMHYLKPALLHRDLKVENVLINKIGSKQKFKLCDFGSAAAPIPAPSTVAECRMVEDDIQKHTTMQYRSPEMVDVYRKQPIDEKSDIWALGVLLYKLCYYTTPFEDQGQLAILNASFRFPSYPAFSDRLKKLIAWTLKENPQARPNIYQVLREACAMQGREVPIKDIYSGQKAVPEKAPHVPTKSSTPVVGAVFSPPPRDEQKLPEIAPMRRGRVPAPTSQPTPAIKPSPSVQPVTNGDPFAALDSDAVAKTKDELSTRFPTVDQFSILHEQGVQFDFDSANSPVPGDAIKEKYDNAFHISQPGAPIRGHATPLRSASPEKQVFSPPNTASLPINLSERSRASEIIMSTPELQAISSGGGQIFQPSPTRPTMVSTGTTMTTPPMERQNSRTPSQYQTHRFPGRHSRSSSVHRNQEANPAPHKESPKLRPSGSFLGHIRKLSSSSRPSLEGGRPSMENLGGEAMSKSRSSSQRPRPASNYLESNLDFLREQESNSKPHMSPELPPQNLMPVEKAPSPDLLLDTDDTNIESNVDFLRSMEESKPKKNEESKRSSLSSSLGKKSAVFAGKFGDAFKRFETNQPPPPPIQARTPSPFKPLERRDLTPIAGSEATDGRSDDGSFLEETEDMSPAMRREMERRVLADEERRVAAAQAEYRARVASRGEGGRSAPQGGSSRASAIQNKVQSLLDENARSSANIKKTAEGYGQYSAPAPVPQVRPDIPRKPVGARTGSTSSPRPEPSSSSLNRASTMSPPRALDYSRPIPPPKDIRPAPPPKPSQKPTHLNKHLTSSTSYQTLRAGSPPELSSTAGMRPTGRLEALIAADLPGEPALDMTAKERDEYVEDFSKRFPSLGAIEMVTRDLAAEDSVGKAGR